MSHANGLCKFPDGQIFHFEYDGTTDMPMRKLWKTTAELHAHWREPYELACKECTCGQPLVEVELWTDYGGGYTMPGKACMTCMVIDPKASLDEDGCLINDGQIRNPEWAITKNETGDDDGR